MKSEVWHVGKKDQRKKARPVIDGVGAVEDSPERRKDGKDQKEEWAQSDRTPQAFCDR